MMIIIKEWYYSRINESSIFIIVQVLIGAVFGLALGRTESEWKTESDRSKQRCLVSLHIENNVL
jgi:hypothetical protein